MLGLSGAPVPVDRSENEDTLVLDMGEFLFENFGAAELGLDHQPGMAALKGMNLMQVLPGSLSQRARIFPAIACAQQVLSISSRDNNVIRSEQSFSGLVLNLS